MSTCCDWIQRKIFSKYWFIKILQIICVSYIMIFTFMESPIGLVDPITKNIIDINSDWNTNQGVIAMSVISATTPGSPHTHHQTQTTTYLRPVVAIGLKQKIYLGFSRASAFSMYPVLVLVFLSKCRALVTFLAKSGFGLYLPVLKDSHKLHQYAGNFICVDMFIHTTFHILRWVDQGNFSLLFSSRSGKYKKNLQPQHLTLLYYLLTLLINVSSSSNSHTGITGIYSILLMLCITIPMYSSFCKEKLMMKYETRKSLHYLFIPFAVALSLHVPSAAIPNGGFIGYTIAFCVGLYTIDYLYVMLFLTEKIETTHFQVLSNGVVMSFPGVGEEEHNGRRRGEKGGFIYVCFPWIDKFEWHAFSVFETNHQDTTTSLLQDNDYDEEAANNNSNMLHYSSRKQQQKQHLLRLLHRQNNNTQHTTRRQIFILNVGDWTNQVHTELLRCPNTTRPIWIQGPFLSPFHSNSIDYDNEILVGSGIGITPAISILMNNNNKISSSSSSSGRGRRIHLIWSLRDAAMLEFFLSHIETISEYNNGWVLVFYTGKEPLNPTVESYTTNHYGNIRIVKGRPELEAVIVNLIHGIGKFYIGYDVDSEQ